MKTFIIAEVGVNHNGNLDLALQSISAAARSGAHAVKFQTFTADATVSRNTALVEYQKGTAAITDQYEMLKSLELSADAHGTIAQRCRELNIEFMSTAFDSQSLDLLCAIGVNRLKIPSGELSNIPFLKDCASRGLPVIISTGMADLDEVRTAVKVVRDTLRGHFNNGRGLNMPEVTVLHCTSAYPTPIAEVNLRAMDTMARDMNVPVGYSDHTVGIFVAPIAVAMGACVIEKHFTLDRALPGPDHAASIEPAEFAAMAAAIAQAEDLLGDGVKRPRQSEMQARELVRRGLKAARNISAGEALTTENIAVLRPATGLPPAMLDAVIGRKTTCKINAGMPIEDAYLI